MRILGLDYGEKHIGLAISDVLGIIASGLCVLENKGRDFVIQKIKKMCKEKEVSKIVIGLPVSLSGKQKAQAKKVREFAQHLKKKINLPIDFEDERLTSSMAKKFLRLEKKKKSKEIEHKLSAQIILQDYLDKKK